MGSAGPDAAISIDESPGPNDAFSSTSWTSGYALRLMLTGDIELPAQRILLADVLKVPHHGRVLW